jgi:hypothetical protein
MVLESSGYRRPVYDGPPTLHIGRGELSLEEG